jgi:hypothetical protein
MLEFFKKLFGSTSTETAAPYKVEAPAETAVSEPALPFPAPRPTKKPAKKPAAKKAVADKPKAPRKPKAPKA